MLELQVKKVDQALYRPRYLIAIYDFHASLNYLVICLRNTQHHPASSHWNCYSLQRGLLIVIHVCVCVVCVCFVCKRVYMYSVSLSVCVCTGVHVCSPDYHLSLWLSWIYKLEKGVHYLNWKFKRGMVQVRCVKKTNSNHFNVWVYPKPQELFQINILNIIASRDFIIFNF